MKKLISLLALFLFISLYAQEDILYTFKGSHYNEISKSMTSCNLEFRYNWKKDALILIIREDSLYSGYLFTKEYRDSVNSMINKYLDWHKKAIDMDAEVDKEISRINIPGFFSFYNSKKTHANGYALLTTYFLSQDLGWHQLIIKFGTIEDRKNRFNRFKPQNIYLDKNQVLEFQKGFKDTYLRAFKENKAKQKRIKKLFK